MPTLPTQGDLSLRPIHGGWGEIERPTVYSEDAVLRRMVDATGEHVPKGRIQVKEFHPVHPTSYWSGGSRDYWFLCDLATGKLSSPVVENGSGFTPDVPKIESLPEGVALLKVTKSAWTNATVYVRPENLAPLLPTPKDELSEDEVVVLVCTASLKAFARRENAARCWGVRLPNDTTSRRWDEAVASLRRKGLVDSRGAITMEGRNRRDAGLPQLWTLQKV